MHLPLSELYDLHGQYKVIFTNRKNVEFVPEIRTSLLLLNILFKSGLFFQLLSFSSFIWILVLVFPN